MAQLSHDQLRTRVEKARSSNEPIRWKSFDGIMSAVATVIRSYVDEQMMGPVIRDLKSRIAKLEGRADAKHLGPFESGRSYAVGNVVTHRGLSWRAARPTYDPPGACEDWEQYVREDTHDG